MIFKRSVLFLTSFSLFSSLFGIVKTWTGTTSNIWTVGTNWAPAGAPGVGDTPTFPFPLASGNFSVDYATLVGPSPAFAGMSITSGASAYTIDRTSGVASLTFSPGATITNSGPSTNTLDGAINILGTPLNVLMNGAGDSLNIFADITETAPSALVITTIGPSGFFNLFSASNSYSGGTTASGPSLFFGIVGDGSFGAINTPVSLTDLTLNITAPTITLSNRPITLAGGSGVTIETFGNTATIPGPISGATNLFIQHGIVNLPNSNVGFTGPITLFLGNILSIGNNNSLGSGGGTNTLTFGTLPSPTLQASATIAIPNNIVLGVNGFIDSQANTLTLNGTISGGAGLTKIGSGTAIFTGANIYGGPTNVNVGTLVINGSITSPTTVAAGATLKGTGTISNSVIVNGTVRPGNSIGTLTVTGPVTFNTGSTYVEELSPAQASLLNVTAGGVTINPGVTLSIIPDPGIYTLGSIYTIVQTTGGVVTGTFSTVTNPMMLLAFTVSYTPNTVLLTLQKRQNAFSNIIPHGNAGAVAACLDQSSPTPGTDFANIVNQLLNVTDINIIKHALNQMQPSQYNALQLTQENINTRLFSVLSLRAGEIHRSCKPAGKNWGIWGDVFGDLMQQDRQNKEHGFHAATGGALLGVDGYVAPQMHVGFGAAFTGTSLEWAGAHGNGNIFSGYGFFYGTWQRPQFFVDAAFVGGYNNYEAKRHIGFLTIDRHAKAEHGGFTLAGRVTGGFPVKVWDVVDITPLASLDYDFVHQAGFKEDGAKSLNLRVHKKDANLLRLEAGIRVTRRCQTSYVKPHPDKKRWAFFTLPETKTPNVEVSKVHWLPSAQVTVIREWRMEGRRTRSRLQGLDCTFSTQGLNPDRTLISPALGITWLANRDRIGVTLDYAGEFSLDGKYWDQKGNIEFSYTF